LVVSAAAAAPALFYQNPEITASLAASYSILGSPTVHPLTHGTVEQQLEIEPLVDDDKAG
jgi:hypothetical protein